MIRNKGEGGREHKSMSPLFFVFLILMITPFVSAIPSVTITAPSGNLGYAKTGDLVSLNFSASSSFNLNFCAFQYNGVNSTISASSCAITENSTLTSDDFGLDYNQAQAGITDRTGMKIQATSDIIIKNITKDGDDASTRGMIMDSSKVNIAFCTFIGNDCQFNISNQINLSSGNTYYVAGDGGGSSITKYRNNGGASYPQADTYLTWTAGLENGESDVGNDAWTINSIGAVNFEQSNNTQRNETFTVSHPTRILVHVNDTNGDFGSAISFWNWTVFSTGESFQGTALETSQQMFKINFTVRNGFTVQQARLVYNGTSQGVSTKNNPVGNNWTISKTIILPQTSSVSESETKNFFWNITLSNIANGSTTTLQSHASTQQVTGIIFNICGVGNATVPVLNFTMFDELTGEEINATHNATTFQATFNLGSSSGNLNKNFSINNQSVDTNTFDFCTNNESNVFFADMNSIYGAVGYSDSNHFLENATLDASSTNEVSLFLLRDSNAIDFFVTVREDLVSPVDNAIVQVSKFFVGEGVYKTVEIDKTDESGKISVPLELDKEYRFTVIKDGKLLGVFNRNAICETAPCEIFLAISGEGSNPFNDLAPGFAGDVLYNLSFNPLTKIVTFDFVDLTGLATSFRMDVIRLNTNSTGNQIVNTQTVFTSSGSITFNATSLPDGDYKVEVLISRSPAELIDFIIFILSSFTESFGLIGLLFAFILIIVIIMGFTLNPSMLVLSIPLAITIAKFTGFLFIGGIALTLLYVLAIGIILLMLR